MRRASRKRGDGATRGRLVVASILVVGWTTALVLYLTAPPAIEDPEIYEMEHSRKVLRDVERIGGKAAVFTTELNDRIESAWEGEHRAYTTACLTAIVAGAYVFLRRAGGSAPADERRPPR